MATRNYQSIGEVLVSVKTEFPDITISKIRFLESEGLIEPERTPSGYRKFYEKDVERLKSILRMQRDEYLPLKVIKDRLLQQVAIGVKMTVGRDEHIEAAPQRPAHGRADPRVDEERPHFVVGVGQVAREADAEGGRAEQCVGETELAHEAAELRQCVGG